MNVGIIKRLFPYVLAGVALLISAAGLYEAGYRSASKHYEAQIAATEKAQAEAVAAAQAQARAKEKESAERLAEALAARDKALARAESVRRDALRVREQSNSVARSLGAMSAADAGSGDGVRERLARCEGLLGEGVRLLGEGAELSSEGAGLAERVAADKDAIISTARLN